MKNNKEGIESILNDFKPHPPFLEKIKRFDIIANLNILH